MYSNNNSNSNAHPRTLYDRDDKYNKVPVGFSPHSQSPPLLSPLYSPADYNHYGGYHGHGVTDSQAPWLSPGRIRRFLRRWLPLFTLAVLIWLAFRSDGPSDSDRPSPGSDGTLVNTTASHSPSSLTEFPNLVQLPPPKAPLHSAPSVPSEPSPPQLPPKSLRFVNWPARQQQVVQAFEHAWKGYKQYAWGHDHVNILAKSHGDWFHTGLTILDSLDTAAIMGLRSIVQEGRDWIEKHLRFNANTGANVFEATIRILGGLLTMYHLEKDQPGREVYLERAVELADLLIVAFDTPSKLPRSTYNFATKSVVMEAGSLSTAEVTTLQLEWRHLAYETLNMKYWKAAEDAMRVAMQPRPNQRYHGLVPIYMDVNSGEFVGHNYRLGSRGDSYYEYLAKQWFQTDRTEPIFRDMFEEALDGIIDYSVNVTSPNGWFFVGELQSGPSGGLTPKMDHLVCFLPGTIMMYITEGKPLTAQSRASLSSKFQQYLLVAEELTFTCAQTYFQMGSGLAPEIVYFNTRHEAEQSGKKADKDIFVQPLDDFSILRPELVESLFYMYRLTGGEEKYREWGWQIFEAFEKHAKVAEGGYTSLRLVTATTPEKDGSRHMESFFLAETLKYLYLLFDEDQKKFPLDEWVFNTEAHPLPILRFRETREKAFVERLKAKGLGLWNGKP